MDGARALIVHDAHGPALRHDEETQDHSRINADSAQRQILHAGERVRRLILNQANSMQQTAERMTNTAEKTQQAILNTADRTARTNLLLATETLAVALSLAASAWLLIDGGQRLGMAYGIAAYQAWATPAHDTRNAQD